MVKFGRHIDAYIEDNSESGIFVVRYNDIKGLCQEGTEFEREWRDNLEKATADFHSATTELWSKVFQRIHSHVEARGALPEIALQIFYAIAGRDAAQEFLMELKQIYQAAYHNTEALRKLVKKFDKKTNWRQHEETALSPKLLPLLYTANFTVGQPFCEENISLLRDILENNSDELHFHHMPLREDGSVASHDSDKSFHDRGVEDRNMEIDWLRRLTESLESDELSRLVAHRGFHSIQDYSHRRPIENSLSAYEMAWTNGIHLCECDIALTKDEKLVLAHDDNFSRLAMNKKSPVSSKKVQDLTFKQLLSLTLTSAARPPLLLDVLQSAHTIGDNAQLIIEIKPGNQAAATALARLLHKYPEFLPCIAMIMSFDAYTMHKLRQHLQLLAVEKDRPLHLRSHSRGLSFSAGNLLGLTPPSGAGLNRKVFSSPALNLTKHRSNSLVKNSDHHRPRSGSISENPSIPSPAQNVPSPPSPKLPKLMLLTVADPPKIPCELRVSVENLSRVEAWLQSDDGELDGVYLQFKTEMLEPQGIAALRSLAEKYSVGVWTYSGQDPDDYPTFRKLVHGANATFVNSDLPSDFRSGVVARKNGRERSK